MTIQKSHLKDPLRGQLGGREEGRKEEKKVSSLPSQKCVLPQAEVPELPYVLNTSDDIEALALHPGHAANVLMSVCVPGITSIRHFCMCRTQAFNCRWKLSRLLR